jgi:hypothetical protein
MRLVRRWRHPPRLDFHPIANILEGDDRPVQVEKRIEAMITFRHADRISESDNSKKGIGGEFVGDLT